MSRISGLLLAGCAGIPSLRTARVRLTPMPPHAQEIAVIIEVQDALRRLQIRRQLPHRIALATFKVSSIVPEAGARGHDHLSDLLTEIRSLREEVGLLVTIVWQCLTYIDVVAGVLGVADKNTASGIVAIFSGAPAAGCRLRLAWGFRRHCGLLIRLVLNHLQTAKLLQ